jgi:hypothetical protein
VNGVTTTTKTGDCAEATTTTSTTAPDLSLLRLSVANLFVWLRVAVGM